MNFILAWLLKPKVLASTAIIVVLLVAFAWYGNKREASGYQKGSVSQLEQDKKQFEQIASQYQATLNTQQAKIAESDAKIASLNTQLAGIQATLTAIISQRSQGQQQVNSLPDAAIQADLETKLGGSLTDSTTLRKADGIVTDYPLVLKQVDALNAKVDNLTLSVSAVTDKVGALTLQRDAAIQFGNTVVGFYVKAYNAAQVHHSKFIKIITLGIVRDRHLDLPSPTSLHEPENLPSR